MAISETLIDLLRHGEAAGGARLRGARTDDALSARGWAELDGATRDAPGWDMIVTSQLTRCRAYATALADRIGADLRVDQRFNEYDFGAWDGREFGELWAAEGEALAAFFGDPDAVVPPRGEAAPDFRARVRAGWVDLLNHPDEGRILLLAHGGVLRQIVGDVLGAGGNLHAALEWPHAGRSLVRVVRSGQAAPVATLVRHGMSIPGPDR